MKILNLLPHYFKGISGFLFIVGIYMFFFNVGVDVFIGYKILGIPSSDFGLSLIPVAFVFSLLSKDRNGIDTTEKKKQALVYTIVINSILLFVSIIIIGNMGDSFVMGDRYMPIANRLFITETLPIYMNVFLMFIIYMVLYHMNLSEI